MELKIEINNIMAEWDPVGMQLAGSDWPYEEYKIHLDRLIKHYNQHGTVKTYLIRYFPPSNKQQLTAFEIACQRIDNVLNKVI